MAKAKILVVDDDEIIVFAIRDYLELLGFTVDEAETCAEAEIRYRADVYDAVTLDYSLPDGNALELLPRLKAIDSRVPIILLTGHASIELAVRAIQLGAEQFLVKPLDLPALLLVIERALENQQNRRKQLARESVNQPQRAVDPFIGQSLAIHRLEEQCRLAAATESPILIQGETGTGKSELARWLHRNGSRASEPMLELNCGGFSKEFLETELFGHEKGAFTGASSDKVGLLEAAHRGTVFLDEIGDMDLQIQPKVLKALEEKRFRRLGGVHDRKVDFRLIAATHQKLDQLVQEQRFRSDLFYRISAIQIFVPSLRERAEDLLTFSQVLLNRLTSDCGRESMHLSQGALMKLRQHHWPGNIRELRNVLERALMGAKSSIVEAQDLDFASSPGGPKPGGAANLTLKELERDYILQVLNEEGGHVDRTAKRLDIPRSTLYQKLKTYGTAPSRF
ncbi:MAG: sigma-54-dependent Fis family transcriptional regulator [Geothrix sp.]|uniref:sigma-54-dependent transcriptional regulator n=1 Tax=Geothrix sp. TaxID=1962974 RepID=UPI00181F63F6|nr:sigma-54 dependent transcriptional regulator [Geothrix sp.]NWJ42543.1 sigma-54-dependent Fis family transcriptional regulator [Geothrix sp.]WIL19496.1 MAG: sigma-54 dependent transcriptional regulator [Geothrix sp.]